jgi:hypothetical protein
LKIAQLLGPGELVVDEDRHVVTNLGFEQAAQHRFLELELDLKSGGDDEYLHSEQIDGCKSFGIWPLSRAAEACFGTPEWPAERPVPQVAIEFDVADAAGVGPAASGLEQTGYVLLHPPREEPWGQMVPGCNRRRVRSSVSPTPRAARAGLTELLARAAGHRTSARAVRGALHRLEC